MKNVQLVFKCLSLGSCMGSEIGGNWGYLSIYTYFNPKDVNTKTKSKIRIY